MRTGAPSGPSTSTFSLTSLISTNTPHPPAWTASEDHAAPPCLDGLGNRGEMEGLDPYRRGAGKVHGVLAGQRRVCLANLDGPLEHLDGAIREPEIVDVGRDLSVLDEVHPVPRRAGEEQSGRVGRPDVPERIDQQAAFGAGDHFVERCAGALI